MADRVLPGPVDGAACIKEAVCIHTRKIFDSCKDSDCVEDLRVYPSQCSQAIIQNATSIRPRKAELLGVCLAVDEISFNRGFYTVDVRYYYKIRGEAYPHCQEVVGLAVFDKRVILFGSEGGAKTFSSDGRPSCGCGCGLGKPRNSQPIAVVEAVDPIALRMSLADADCGCPGLEPSSGDIPEAIGEQFPSPVMTGGGSKVWLVTLGQFSIIRLERDVQLLMPSYDYCMPDKECAGSSEDDPCTLFSKIRFPLEEFYPPDSCPCCGDDYRTVSQVINETK